MTAATIDPAIAVAAAGRELLDSLRELVDRDDAEDVPGLLDEVTALLRRARGKVNRAVKRDESPGRQPSSAPAKPPAPPVTRQPTPNVATPVAKVDRSGRAVTVALPPTTTKRIGAEPITPGAKKMSNPAQPALTLSRRRWALIAGVALIIVVLIVLLTAAASSAATVNSETANAGRLASFLDAEHPNDTYWGVAATDKQLTDIGLTACAFYRRSLSDLEVLTSMMGGPSGPSMVPPAGTQARELGLQRVRNAKRFLCP